MNNSSLKIKTIAYLGIMVALIFVLSMVERMLPPLPVLPPQMKPGLSNVVIMYCVFFIGRKQALFLALAKSTFVFMTRGYIAAVLSLSGGLLSLMGVIIAVGIFKNKISLIMVSIISAILHNLGQIAAYSLITSTLEIFYYFPVLLISGVVLGYVSGVVLQVILPVLGKTREAGGGIDEKI